MKRLATLALASLACVSLAQPAPRKPKLIVMISIDQFRADYVTRFASNFLPARSGGKVGGFRFLTESGAWFRDAHHNHIPTATGPGHATLLSGSEPGIDGIVGNDWFDRATGKPMYCVDDKSVETVGGTSSPMSPRNLKTTTLGDELKMATNGRAKVVSLALKDRAAILMAGHAADQVVWFDNNTGNWVTSTWYARQLPGWAEGVNRDRLVDKAYGTSWEPLLDAKAYDLARKAPAEKPAANGKLFSWPLGVAGGKADKAYWGALWTSHWGNEFVEQSAERALDTEKLGQRDVSDLLIVGFSSNDYIGHRFGPNSPEVMDATVRTDRLLSQLFTAIDRKVGLDNAVIVLSGDHGVLPIPEEESGVYRSPSTRYLSSVVKPVREALNAAFGEGDWLLGAGIYEQNLYINRETAAAKKVRMEDVERVAAEAAMKQPGVFLALTRTQLLNGQVPAYPFISRVVNGFSPTLGGDVMVVEAPGAYFGAGTGTGHGSAWDYDSHVPIIFRGAGISRGVFTRRVATADIAPTLAHLLGIELPSGNVGRVLGEAIR
ncbi:alkaline phosphatase family protein [Fimbriimonas ginsengisoli]|uniref:Type I phosphodiesterase/nucleotide pyrophosphatase n=1 Tax=Fimbriimonas ginsengisoli Gsoil 348 TaxID=661478 RepID=A0A068NVS6_FIMGI|nr:alkaline phosphatase family protein [Fimbriimonas ginsengisoli]AIE87603.1 type I phosphodiesterase/nucleotide pyrophosphatase [Fimbriimonas ginsengisoli Gsoil 348]